jgi:hypothetical protein
LASPLFLDLPLLGLSTEAMVGKSKTTIEVMTSYSGWGRGGGGKVKSSSNSINFKESFLLRPTRSDRIWNNAARITTYEWSLNYAHTLSQYRFKVLGVNAKNDYCAGCVNYTFCSKEDTCQHSLGL